VTRRLRRMRLSSVLGVFVAQGGGKQLRRVAAKNNRDWPLGMYATSTILAAASAGSCAALLWKPGRLAGVRDLIIVGADSHRRTRVVAVGVAMRGCVYPSACCSPPRGVVISPQPSARRVRSPRLAPCLRMSISSANGISASIRWHAQAICSGARRARTVLMPSRTHERFDQTYRGLPVWAAGSSRQLDSRSDVSLFGTLYEGIAIEVEPKLTPEAARDIVSGLAGGADLGARSRAADSASRRGGYALVYRWPGSNARRTRRCTSSMPLATCASAAKICSRIRALS